ncbi:DUF4145 domain-containing protein [Gracilibacillus kekensis]|uniref:Uncharacterized protein n=1 Tax=Gracilibacillus kekensis TaxID=1027249 RepID=A0A1M7LFK4_9BACI|nr:DUF4145 domain-containing protein [Gracilibacillus kekensis]SHM76202.1 protein of unknown function [Gracilibacillus kekensis]
MISSKLLDNVGFYTKSEIEKVKFLIYFQTNSGINEVSLDEICETFVELGLASPNKSRLKTKLNKSKLFVKGKRDNHYKLHASLYMALKNDISIPSLSNFNEIESFNSVLDKSSYINTRGYLERLAKQINASYENNIFDGCAVLMRRFLEILLIHTYEKYGIDSEIKDSSNNFKMLSDIIKNVKNNTTISLSRNTKECLDIFRELGNFSAHKIYFNARKNDIDHVMLNYRATIEELLYKSGIKK